MPYPWRHRESNLLMFILQDSPINTSKARNIFQNPADGAIVTFEGTVRADQYQGKTVSDLLYIADTTAVLAEGEKIIIESLSKFTITESLCIQRIGQVKTLETAIWIGVWSSHRDEAFKGCRYIIEEVKKRLLIWKKEIYTDGSSRWIHGTHTPVKF